MKLKNTINAMASTRGMNVETLSKEINKSPANTRLTIKHGNPSKDFLKAVAEALDYDLAFVDKNTNNIFKL
jgi:hypothetical protein